MTYYFDENVSEYLVKIIQLFDRKAAVKAHIECFAKGTADEVWIPTVAGWTPRPG